MRAVLGLLELPGEHRLRRRLAENGFVVKPLSLEIPLDDVDLGGEMDVIVVDMAIPIARDFLSAVSATWPEVSLVAAVPGDRVDVRLANLGLVGFVVHHWQSREMVAAVQRAVSRTRAMRHAIQAREGVAMLDQIVLALACAVEAKDGFTEDHCGRVQEMVMHLAREFGLPAADMEPLRLGAVLHDVGKIGIADAVLLKPGPLNEREWEAMREHPEKGARIVSQVHGLAAAVPVVAYHHEHWDGTGYPAGLRGEEIVWGARVVALADAYEAMTSDRPYRKALSREHAIEELIGGRGTQFDPTLLDAFLVAVAP